MGKRVKRADFQRLNLRCHALLNDVPLHDVWAIPLKGGGPGRSIQDALVSCSAMCADLLTTSRFEDYLRCGGPWVERSDGMTSAMIHPVRRTFIALLKPTTRSLRFLRGLARARFECSTFLKTKPSVNCATPRCMPFWRSLSRRAREATNSIWQST
jgi:hypothetical protein